MVTYKTVDALRENTDILTKYRGAINNVFASWEKLPYMPSHWHVEGVQDLVRDRYALQMVDFKDDKYRSSLLAHLEIRDNKIWILTDNTEEGIATELLTEGIAKSEIVLAFYPPALREMGEFAVS